MRERILFVPNPWSTMVPGGVTAIPALDGLVRDLSGAFDVDVFSTYSGRSSRTEAPGVVPFQQAIASLRASLSTGCHVLVMGWAAPEVFLALDRVNTISSLVCAGCHPGEATFRAFGMSAVADALERQFGLGLKSSYAYFRLLFRDYPEPELRRLVDSVDERTDWDAYRSWYHAYGEVDLTGVRIEVPTLYLHSKTDMAGMRDLFVQLVPHAEIGESLHTFPTRLYDADTAREVSVPALEFFAKVGAQSIVSTVMFVDIVDSTGKAERLGNRRWVALLGQFYEVVRKSLFRHSGRELDTAGDGVFAAFDSPSRAVRCAGELSSAAGQLDLEVRAGLHHGECERIGEKLTGMTVNVAARAAALASPGEVLVSQTLKDVLAGADLSFEDKGTHALKGMAGQWRLYRLAGSAGEPS